MLIWWSAIAFGLLLFQGTASLILLARILKGARRREPLQPQPSIPDWLGKVSVVVPTLNEAARIDPCLEGLSRQGYEVREIIVVDSNSTDGTREKVQAKATLDPRFHLTTDKPLPSDWVGRPWALHHGFLTSSPKSDWILGIDADTKPQPGLISSLLQVATAEEYDLITLAPQFMLHYGGEWWLQPALLMTLLYRFEVAGVAAQRAETVMANGQCFFCRRQVLEQIGGYRKAAGSFCDDVTLARQIAQAGYRVGFLDGSKVIKVRMYEGAAETWQEWGRSLDLKDASSSVQLRLDLALLLLVQALPLPLAVGLGGLIGLGYQSPTLIAAWILNLCLLGLRWGLLLAIASSYDRTNPSKGSWLFWLSPLADPLAVARIFISASQKPTQWRGRNYTG